MESVPAEQAETTLPDVSLELSSKATAERVRKKTIYDLNLNDLDRNLLDEERRKWSAIYASYRAKSVLTGTERPPHVLRNMVGSQIDYVIMEVDREGRFAIGSRRVALAAKRHFFATARRGHNEGDLLKCRVLTVGAKRCTVECGGYDIPLSQRDLSYTAMANLREKYHPGQELTCKLKSYDQEAGQLVISVKKVKPNPFDGADNRHPQGNRRQAVISGKYAGGVFCTLPDDTICLCLYSSQHSDTNFDVGDSVIIAIRSYDYPRQLIFGRILAKW